MAACAQHEIYRLKLFKLFPKWRLNITPHLHPIKIGNDIVDLSSSENKYKYLNNRFCDRVFTANENKTIGLCLDKNKDKILWSIWAAKEAAFKTCQKKIPEIIFAHKKFSLCKKTLENLIDANFNENLIGTLIYNSLKIQFVISILQIAMNVSLYLWTIKIKLKN